ncbi:hypothetical protein G6F64_014140 [Rhizopus arrhizus]|uniref:Uncharacterized protein n=1 Tax=Rhizopus oryzae TaxID=64495 RepID=A0A9P6WU46_RHIOR|nr:hypothetical protein G6F64_014140 [Rhizopus arrhizus]
MCENVFLSHLHIKWGAPSVSGITPFTLVIPKIVASGTSANPSSRTSWVRDSLSASNYINEQQTLGFRDLGLPWPRGTSTNSSAGAP